MSHLLTLGVYGSKHLKYTTRRIFSFLLLGIKLRFRIWTDPAASVQPTPPSQPQPVHICCLLDPKRPRTLADPSSEDKAYVCSDIINGRGGGENNGSRIQKDPGTVDKRRLRPGTSGVMEIFFLRQGPTPLPNTLSC